MKICIMSDSHENVENIRAVFNAMIKERVDFYVHLGDDYSDTEGFRFHIRVPGVYDEEYTLHGMKHRIIHNFDHIKALISHTERSHVNDFPSDKKPEDIIARKEVDLVLYGHSHEYAIKQENGIVFVNPGHLKTNDKKGLPPTYALLEIEGRKIKAKIIGLNNEIKLEKEFQL